MLPEAVGNHGQATAHKFLGHNDLVARAVHGPHHIKAGARVIHVHVAAGVENYAALVVGLVHMAHELAECLGRKGGQGRAFVDTQRIQHHAGNRIKHAEVLERRRNEPQPFGHELAVTEHPVAQTGGVFFELVGPCHHVEAGNRHAVRARDIAVFAVGAVVQRGVFRQPKKAKALIGRAYHARPQKLGGRIRHGAVHHAGGAGYAFVWIDAHAHWFSPAAAAAAAMRPACQPVAMATP